MYGSLGRETDRDKTRDRERERERERDPVWANLMASTPCECPLVQFFLNYHKFLQGAVIVSLIYILCSVGKLSKPKSGSKHCHTHTNPASKHRKRQHCPIGAAINYQNKPLTKTWLGEISFLFFSFLLLDLGVGPGRGRGRERDGEGQKEE